MPQIRMLVRSLGFLLLTIVGIAASFFRSHWAENHQQIVSKVLLLSTIGAVLCGVFWMLTSNAEDAGEALVPASSNNSSSVGSIDSSSKAENRVENHIHLSVKPLQDVAKAIADELRRGSGIAGDGFVQLEELELLIPSAELMVGQKIELKYSYANRGVLPVYDVQSWGLLQVLNPKMNPSARLKEVLLAGIKEGHKKYREGGTLGVGMSCFAFAPLSQPLTQNQMIALKEEREVLYFLVGGVWRDNEDNFHYWVDGRCAELPLFPSLKDFRLKNL